MTVEELARAMEKDIGGSDNFIRKNVGTLNIPTMEFLFAMRLRQSKMKMRLVA